MLEKSEIMIEAMWLAITQIEAQNLLSELMVADWPNMKKEARKKRHKELAKAAWPDGMKAKNYVSIEDLQRALSR